MPEVVLNSAITCPECGHAKVETMPTDACQFFYDCAGCGTVLRPKPGDCCVFCSYGSVPCPPIQAGDGCCTEGQVRGALATDRAETRGQRAEARQLQRAAAWLGRPPGRRRRSPRVIQEIIRAVFAMHPSAAFLTKDLCEILHPSLPTRRHIAETNRQAREVMAADPHWTCELSADQRQVVFFNCVNERNVEAAQTLLAPKPKQPRMRRPSRPRRAVVFPT